MAKLKNLIDVKIGRLVVISRAEDSLQGRVRWNCLCDCGNVTIALSTLLINGSTRSCGCLSREIAAQTTKNRTRHGHCSNGKESRTYNSWRQMIRRCYNLENESYHNYGGRGITVCDRWRDSFVDFLEDMGECPDGCFLEKKDNDGNYEPCNCRWATHHDQCRNKRTNIWVNMNGEEMIVTDALRLLGVSGGAFYSYMRRHGASHQEAIDYYVSIHG
jgi:hypothetical protein